MEGIMRPGGLRLAAAVIAASVVACTDSGALPDYEGTWSYSTGSLTGDGLTCSISGLTLEFENQGSAQTLDGVIFGEFDGTHEAGTMVCAGPDGEDSVAIEPGEIMGTFEGNAVQILLESSDWENTGTLMDDRITGLVFRRLNIEGQAVRLEGDFTATR